MRSPRVLRSKLAWPLCAGFLTLIAITATIIGVLDHREVVRNARESLRHHLRDCAALLRELATPDVLDAAAIPRLRQRIRSIAVHGTRLTLIDAGGRVLADSMGDPALMENQRERPEVRAARGPAGEGFARRFSPTGRQDALCLALPIRSGGRIVGYARAARSASEVTEPAAALGANAIFGALVAMTVACLLALAIVRSVTTRLRAMTEVADALVSGDYKRRVPPLGPDEIGKLARAFNAMADELNSRMETIAKERKEVLAILQSMVEGVVAVDRDQRVVLINHEAHRILRISGDDVRGRPIWEVTRIQAVCDILDQVIQSAQTERGEISVTMRGGDRAIELHSTPLRNDRDEVVGAVLVLHDITELRHLEEVRRDFVTNVSHELKTPLTAIRGFVETLIDDDDTDPRTQRRFLGKIRDHAHRLSSLVSDLLTLSRVESKGIRAEQKPLDLREPVRASAALLSQRAEDRGLRLTVSLPDEPVPVIGDSEMLRQVADNLIDNAISYTPTGGDVRVRVGREGDRAVLEVTDNGQGLGPQDQQRIFERFYRVDRGRSRELGGTGLGLSIVKHVVLAHEGDIAVDSTLGVGSSFCVKLPLAHDESPDKEVVTRDSQATDDPEPRNR